MELLKGTSPKLQAAMQHILDVFSGADGGGSFALFCALLVDLDRQAKKGDAASGKLLEMVTQFDRLLYIPEGVKRRGV